MHQRFPPEPMPGEDYTAFVLREVAAAGWAVHARITVLAPAAEVLARINPTVGVVESVDEATSVLVTGADSLEVLAVYIGMLGLEFRVGGPARAGRAPARGGGAVRASGRRRSSECYGPFPLTSP